MPTGKVTLAGLAAVIAALVPENAIIIDESITSGRGLLPATSGSIPHDWLANTGGSIGIALPLAVGAAVACPDRGAVPGIGRQRDVHAAGALDDGAREA